MNDSGTYESRTEAYNAGVKMLETSAAHGIAMTGAYVCRRKQGDYLPWPMGSQLPKSYRVVDEVYRT